MKFIIYPQQDNTIAIVASTGALPIKVVAQKDVPQNTKYVILDTLNVDGDFHEAYEFDEVLGAKLNISKAKEVQKDKFRLARKPILEKLDVEYMKALEAGDTQKQQEIVAKKQALRDVTNASLPDTLEGIKNTWPEILNILN